MKNKILLNCDKLFVGISYQSDWFDFFFQYHYEWYKILFKNEIKGGPLRKHILYWPHSASSDGYGIYADAFILGLRIGIYITLFENKKK